MVNGVHLINNITNNISMQVTITIPQPIIEQCLECGYTEQQAKGLFQEFMEEITNDGYGQFITNFGIWLNETDKETDE